MKSCTNNRVGLIDRLAPGKEEEKKENIKASELNVTNGENLAIKSTSNKQENQAKTRESSKSPVRTRLQNKMESVKTDKPKPVKKTVTFGKVESCEDTFMPLKKLPSKNQAPLVPIIKKKSALKQTEYSTFNSILKPAKLTDLCSKSSDYQEGYQKKNLNPLSKSSNRFSQISESRCISPPPRSNSPDRDGSKFILPLRSAHSSRVIKPNKRFIDGEELGSCSTTNASTVSSISSGKVLKKPKLKQLVFNNLLAGDDSPEEELNKNESERSRDKLTLTSSTFFKDKTSNSFPNLNGKKSGRDLFSSEKDQEYVPDENSNLEGLEKFKRSESHKEERSHALRKLKDISDASSTSSTSSGSESEESWESDSLAGSGEEADRPQSPEREKAPASQLLSGKVIIREARLQLNPSVPSALGPDGPFSTFSSATSGNPPTTVTCGVCGAVRFYRFVKQARKFGIYSCESCRKFISKMLKKEKSSGSIVMQCLKGEGNCHVPPIVRSQQWKLLRCANKARCPACWLKMCLKAFQIPPSFRAGLTAMLPPYMRSGAKPPPSLSQVNPLRLGGANTLSGQPTFGALTNNTDGEKAFSSLKTSKKVSEDTIEKVEDNSKKDPLQQETTTEELSSNRKRRLPRMKVRKKEKSDSKHSEDTKRQKVELKGPRVKHVCRSASIVLGQPIATFPTQEEKEKMSASPMDETSISNKTDQSCETELDLGNKMPQIISEPSKDLDSETQMEAKKRKVEITQTKLLSKLESSEDETGLELLPRKSIMKPLSNITNVKGRSQKCGQNRPELICVDFWESYDPDEVCSSGFGLIGTTPFTVAHLCFLCGSAGQEKMLVCGSCCEWYHSWCAEEPGGAGDAAGPWVCGRCVSCAACSRPAARLRCRSCARHYHAACLAGRAPPQDHRSDWPQICSNCLKCKSCDSARVSKFVGSLPFCSSCFKLRQKGNYCPLCQACYRDNDFDSKMMECGWCARWVHASCEGLSGEGYQLLSALPPSIEYICRQCMPHDPPWRKMLTEHLKGRLLHLLKLLAKNKKACALLKLTPHKNTPVASKTYRLMSPQAIRKLHFDSTEESLKNTVETKVYRNTSRGRKNKIENVDIQNDVTVPCPSIFDNDNILCIKEDIPQPSHKVVNLQEPLMQNKEICFSTGLYGTKTEYDTPCVEVHEINPPVKEIETDKSLLPTTIHDDKYDAISDDDEPMRTGDSVVRSEQDLSPVLIRRPLDSSSEEINRIISPSLLDIKKRVNSDEYMSLKNFNHDMKEVIERTMNGDLKSIYKDLFSETFPWFDSENNCLQPNLEVEGVPIESESSKDQEMTDNKGTTQTMQCNIERPLDQIVPKVESEGEKVEEELLDFYPVIDTRLCVLCKKVGDGIPTLEGRLLYCGQNDWIHSNCALWSAEVFEEIDGSLQNVHSAISRGKMIKCADCDLKGASVGCCAKNCSETYHYGCARNQNCAFMDDKRVFCPAHGKDVPKKSLQKDTDFELTRPVYVELDKKKKRYSEINKVQFLLGSLTVQNLGKIVPPVSDFEEFLMPVDFMCTRLFWSSKKPLKIVRYTIKTKLILAEPLPGFDYGVNITVDHSSDVQVVDRVMAEIGAWHESLETGNAHPVLMLKKDKSPIKFGGVRLEDLAVKQVVEYLLDNVCKQEQDEEEPQNTADLLPPELKDAIFEDLNHDLLDGISMQDIFPKLMSYEDLAVMDLKSEFYGAEMLRSGIIQGDDKTVERADSRPTDFLDELLNARLESGSKELKRTKSEMIIQNHNLKSLTTGRGQPKSSSLNWNNKLDTSLLSSTIKRCKMGRTSTVTGKLSPVQRLNLTETSLDSVKESETDNKTKEGGTSSICEEAPHTSGLNYCAISPKQKDSDTPNGKPDKSEGYYTDVIDFYTKIQCSPISQLDGACDWSGSESTCSSRPNSPQSIDNTFTPIPQLDGTEENDNIHRNQNNHFMYRASGSESTYTVTIAGNTVSGQPELVMRPLDDGSVNSGQTEQPVRCDRCQCTYRNKESYDRHIASCDMMSTSESESENPKSPESRTLTTLQNAFQSAFAQPMIIHTGVVNGSEANVKAEGISTRRTSINTRQITINGTIVETPSPGPSNEMTMTITEQMKSGTVIFDQTKNPNGQMNGSQQVMSSPQIVVTPQMLLPPKTSNASGQKIMSPQIITQPAGVLPYNICVKPGNPNNMQPLQNTTDMTQILSGTGGIQVLSSNANQVLTIPSQPQGNIAPMIQGKNQVANFPNMASAPSIALPVNSIQGMPSTSIIPNIQPMIRPQIQGNPTIVMPTMTAQRLASPNSQNKQQIILPSTPQKSPKKQPPVQPKPIFQAASRGRGRPMPKPTTIKRQTKLEKTFTTINQPPIGPGNTVIQLQTNNQTGQPSIIVQPVANQNIVSAYVEALSQQQNQNMQYIATITPQGDFKTTPTQFISQGGLMPQTFQIQQTESGGLVAVPSGGIPVLLPQGNVGIIPQAIQQGATILPQGTIQTQGIISQGPNGATILPQAIHTPNGTAIIPQGTIQGIAPGSLTSQTATLLPNNALQTAGATVVPNSGINNTQTTIIPNTGLQTQGNALISSTPGATILPQGTLLPQGMQFCNDQVILGSTPTLEMVTDPSGCMYLTTTQPVYYGLETIVQNTVMSSQQFVSTAMQGVLAQNSSFSATTTQVFQASKIEPIVEVPTGYVVVNNVGDGVTAPTGSSAANIVTGQTIQTSPQTVKSIKSSVPNLTLQPLPEKNSNNNNNRQTPKVVQMTSSSVSLTPQPQGSASVMNARANINPITSQIHNMTLSTSSQNLQRNNSQKQINNVSMGPNVTLVSSAGQPVMAISQPVPNTSASFSMQSIPMSHPIVSSSIAPSMNKTPVGNKIENSHVIEISGNLQENSNVPTISVTQNIKSPTPWRQVSSVNNTASLETFKQNETPNVSIKSNLGNTHSLNAQSNGRHQIHGESDKLNQNCLVPISTNNSISLSGTGTQQYDTIHNVCSLSGPQPANNMIQITAGNIYPPSSGMNTLDADTTLKLSKINALSKTEGGHLNFSQEIMAPHAQQHSQNEKNLQTISTSDKYNIDGMNSQINVNKLSSCQMAGLSNSTPSISIVPHNMIRPQMQSNQNSVTVQHTQNQMCAMSNNGQLPLLNQNNTMPNLNVSCQESANSRINMNINNENIHQTHQLDLNQNNQAHAGNLPQGNMQIVSHENSQHSSSNQIHILNGQIQHNRHTESAPQMHQAGSQMSSNRSFHENIMNVAQHSQCRNMSESSTLLSPSNLHNVNNSHMSRSQNDMSHMHIQQSISNVNNIQNNRMLMDNMHQMNNINHHGRPMENMHNQMLPHNMQSSQYNNHMNNRQQIENGMHLNQQMPMQQNRQMDNVGHHQHQIPNVMQMQNNRAHIDNNIMGVHQHLSNDLHSRPHLDNSMHMHHLSGNSQNMGMNNQLDNSGAVNQNVPNIHNNRHDSNTLVMQNMNVINQMQNNNRNSMDHAAMMQHQIPNINNIANMHNNMNNAGQLNSTNHQNINNSIMHAPNIPDIKSEMQSSCSGSCSNNTTPFNNSQTPYEMCSNTNMNTNSNISNTNIIHGINVNNSNIVNNNMMMSNNAMFNNTSQNMATHDVMMSCNGTSEHGMMSTNTNHMILNNTQNHNNNQNQMLGPQVTNNMQMNMNNMNVTTNHNTHIENQINRTSMSGNDPSKFPQEQMRGKNMMSQASNNVGSMTIPNSDCAKVNIVSNDKQNHTISVNNQIGYMQMNSQNNRIINLPERNRMIGANADSNINQHIPQQHNIRVVTNSNTNVGTINNEFQQRAEANSTMINVPLQAIPNSAPMNINVNSSNNTVNITVQNNLVDPKIASKGTADINFPIQANNTMLQNQNNSGNLICLPVNNNTINLPTQNSSSITLPKAPPTQQSGIPTNVVNPMSMRPMNRVLPLHRDGQSKIAKTAASKSPTAPRPRQTSHDMPDLNTKDETIDSDLEKAIEESKRMMELEKRRREKEELDAARAMQLSMQMNQNADIPNEEENIEENVVPMETDTKMDALPNLNSDMEIESVKVLIDKDINKPLSVTNSASISSKTVKRHIGNDKKNAKPSKGQENSKNTPKQSDPPKDDGPKLIYEVISEDGFNYSSSSLTDLWAKVVEAVQNARKQMGLPLIQYNLPPTLAGAHLLGLNNNALRYLIEQLPGANRCSKYKAKQGRLLSSWDNDLDISEGFKESPWGSARTGPIPRKQNHDMFSWMASPFREEPPPFNGQEGESIISRRLATLPLAMRFRHLKETSKASVGVYRSHIHGRGLFCKRDIEEGDMVIEYAGEVIRAVLADQREKRYEARLGRRGVAGCYMFRIDDNLVVDATLKGNAARFINHSCDPNCYSRVVDIHGHKHILIFALRRITVGEELTYDYKFPFEEVKIPCTCGAKKCRKYLN
ncbi:Histone-lysine N-methyltransferase trithorax [Eumeta japonica]|uniref:Histone-lysine N-methyltransferase trithorax n=1 Tax=Eumeta variegata TaxID=151549 RepID=A0A4C1TN78_EUMVA|nr:Histone-lysine N-methyltransferase trithorax [Eumeta japonica]